MADYRPEIPNTPINPALEEVFDDGGWMCSCGHYEDSDYHCSHCMNEPPWGCACRMCESPPDLDPDEHGEMYDGYHEAGEIRDEMGYGDYPDEDYMREEL